MIAKTTFLPFIFFYCFIFFTSAHAQVSVPSHLQPSSLTVNAEGQSFLPADLIVLQINLQVTADVPGEAFEKHKELENTVSELITGFGLPDSAIIFQPFQISRYRNNNRNEIRTNQQVQLTLQDFSDYERIQVLLIENGFDNFRADFQTTKINEGDETSLQNAIRNARRKASLIAKESGLKIERIEFINYSENSASFPVLRAEMSRADIGKTRDLTDVPQFVKFTNRIEIRFKTVSSEK